MNLSVKEKLTLGALIVLLCALVVLGFFYWRSYVITAQEERCYAEAAGLLNQSRIPEALTIIRTSKSSASAESYEKWISLEIRALEQSRNIHRLLYLYGQSPGSFMNHEEASILVERALLKTQNMELFHELRNLWRSHEQRPELWLALDVDALLSQGEKDKALALLNSRQFEGPADCGRLVRLAILKAGDNLADSWSLLEKAYLADPRNPDVRSFRAQILEYTGKMTQARVEYVAAHLAEPDNPILRDQLAEYYRRQGNYRLALKTWADGLNEHSLDFFWLKTIFWSRITHPFVIDRPSPALADGDLVPLITYLFDLPPDMFWDDYSLGDNPRVSRLLDTRQEIYWLRLIQALKDGSETRAMDLLKASPHKRSSYHPDLERALEIVLVYRRWGVIVNPVEGETPVLHKQGRHQFFQLLNRLTQADSKPSKINPIPDNIEALLKSDEAFAAVFLAGGWIEAALALHKLPLIPDDFPDWVSYGLTQAMRYNRGNKAAIEFSAMQKSNESLNLLTAEIMLAENDLDEAIRRLSALTEYKTDIGLRASWLLSLAYLNNGNPDKSKHIIDDHADLASSIAGKELLGRIALSKDNTAEADRIYGSVANDSLEAKAYLARKAYQKKDWENARALTEELLMHFPDRLQLRQNLDLIAQQQENDNT
ncbi:MAG TPA: hypothetical protein ENN05_09530 [Deltaproteobacteria bacterium]|nr:hypothetical protein [Deltaproteobacteria bacterium]